MFLNTAEAEYNLLIGIIQDVMKHPDKYNPLPFFAAAIEGQTVKGIAINNPPYPFVISRFPFAALPLLVDSLVKHSIKPIGIVGPVEDVTACANLYCTLQLDITFKTAKKMRIYQLHHITQPKTCSGRLRTAEMSDYTLVAEWVHDFYTYIKEKHVDADAVAKRVIADQRLFLWETDKPVSMAAWVRDTINSKAIALVYTPKNERKHGYASACVAEVCKRALDLGKTFCVLYADILNPISNSIYKNIGFKEIADSLHIEFIPDSTSQP